jgi:hypothetical protein
MKSNLYLLKIMKLFHRILTSLLISIAFLFTNIAPAWAFCGFYVGGADAKLFNQASQVIIARKDDKTILTMANDFQGAVKDFALVVPVPVAIKREQVNIGDKEILKKLDTFSQPRLVEYNDTNPCDPPRPVYESGAPATTESASVQQRGRGSSDASLGVTVEDRYKVNEYEILILSAKESDGLETWLRRNDYKLPNGASEVLRPYIRQNMKFFVAKVDLKEFEKNGNGFLRPLQIAYRSPKFMLPIRLGMLNAKGDQDLIVYALSSKGKVEVSNYRTVNVPSGEEIPEFIKNDFGKFYKATFQRSYEKADKKVAFLEYAWDVSNCDPCSTTPPTNEELKKAGVFWQNNEEGGNTFISRLHVRYSRNKFPEDLVFSDTTDRQQFQGRYVMNHPYRGKMTCAAAKEYKVKVTDRQRREARNLAQLTGWNLSEIQRKIEPVVVNNSTDSSGEPFWPW